MNKYETIYKQKRLPWGADLFYQSFKLLDLEGERNTEHRFEKYKFEYLLMKNMSVLDIGSNCGFLDLYISEHVKNIEGVEIETHLCELANLVKDELNIKNVNFYNEDFNKFKTNNKYDLILSLAQHAWMHNNFKDYINKIKRLLTIDGLFMIESHKINIGIEPEFENKLKEIEELGFTKLYTTRIDSGRDERIFAIFRLGKFKQFKIANLIETNEFKYYKRLDVAMTCLTLDELTKGSNKCELYRKYHSLRHGWINMDSNLETLKQYSDTAKDELVCLLKPIVLNRSEELFDGCHRLSSVIYHNQKYILAKKLELVTETDINETKLLKNGLSQDEIETMREKSRQIVKEYSDAK